MKKLFAREYLECFFDEEPMILFHVWLRKPTSAEFRDGLISVCGEFTEYKKKNNKALHWLGDTRNVGVLSIEDQEKAAPKKFLKAAGDFKKTDKSVVAFINRYANTKLSEKAELNYQDYDWNLNER